MILSMTGIGRSRHQDDQIQATVEVRAVNNKYLKLNLRLPDALNGKESEIDRLVRKYLERGTISINVQLTWVRQVSPYVIDEATLNP
ncbi:MAG TPA: YicC family protein, partial [Planctomycetaceae bacterium]|nr:YicC family protein [Planctomycetaceae bacterium]